MCHTMPSLQALFVPRYNVSMTAAKKTRGRPKLDDDTVTLNVRMPRDLRTWIEDAAGTGKVGEFVRSVLEAERRRAARRAK